MDYERERGRIKGWATRRKRGIDRASLMVPVFALARFEIKNWSNSAATLEQIAEWLNRRGYRTTNGKEWRKQSVHNFAFPEEIARKLAKHEFETAKQIAEACRATNDDSWFEKEIEKITLQHDDAVERARDLGKALRGEH